MKLFKWFFLFIALSLLNFYCKKEENKIEKNSIATDLEVDGFLTVEPEQEFSFIVKAKNPESIVSFKINRFQNQNLTELIIDTSFAPIENIDYKIKSKVGDKESIEKYVFSYLDKNGKSYSKDFIVNVVSRLFTYKVRLKRSAPDLFDVKNCLNLYSNQLLTIQEGYYNSVLVDLVYFQENNNSDFEPPKLGGPFDGEARKFFSHPSFRLTNWKVRNKTVFKNLGSKELVFEKLVKEDSLIKTASLANEFSVVYPVKGQVIAFKTVNSKFGILRIDSVNIGTLGFIDFSVKIQKY